MTCQQFSPMINQYLWNKSYNWFLLLRRGTHDVFSADLISIVSPRIDMLRKPSFTFWHIFKKIQRYTFTFSQPISFNAFLTWIFCAIFLNYEFAQLPKREESQI